MFDRYDDINIKAYDIIVSETLSDGSVTEYTLVTLPNPSTATPILVKKVFPYSQNGEYKLPSKRIYYNEAYRIHVYINGRKLNSLFVIYNEQTKTVALDYHNINEWDTIEIEYYYDGIKYNHSSINHCVYSINLIIDYTKSTIGNHNLLL